MQRKKRLRAAQGLTIKPEMMQSLSQAAKSLGLSVQRLRVLAAQGRISGAIKSGSVWILPDPVVITPRIVKRRGGYCALKSRP